MEYDYDSLRHLSRHRKVIRRATPIRVDVLDALFRGPGAGIHNAAHRTREPLLRSSCHATVSNGGLDELFGFAELHTESLQDPEMRVNNFFSDACRFLDLLVL